MQQPLFRPYIEGPLAAALGVNETRAGDVRRVSELLPPTLRQNVSSAAVEASNDGFAKMVTTRCVEARRFSDPAAL